MNPDDDRSTGAAPDDNLDACLRAAFSGPPQRRGGEAGDDSIVNLLSSTLGFSVQLSLRDLDDEHSPVVRARATSDTGSLLPERIGRYRISGEIASGGMGSVFRAHDVDLGRDVAFKVLRDRHAGNPDMTRRFLEEAQIGGQLQHPGIVSVHEMGLLEGARPYFTMKLVKGRTLTSLLRERKSPAEERQRFLGIFEQICQPVAYAHARGVVHRDLKPSNVMVGAFGEVQVMDWGLAKVLARGGAEDDRRKTKAPSEETVIRTLRSGEGSSSLVGSVLGTPAYMAPEQARGDVDDLDECSDVFGLGAVLCEILTGEPPYRGESVEEVHRQARNGDLADAQARLAASGADAEIVDLARRCLALERAGRPRNAGAVARDMRAYFESLEARAREERERAARARMRTVVVAAAMVVLAAVGLSGLWLEMERRDALNESTLRARELMAKAEAHLVRAGSDPTARLGETALAREAFEMARTLIARDSLPVVAVDLDRLGASVERSIRRATFLARLAKNRDTDEFYRGIDGAYDEAFTDLLGGSIFDLSPKLVAERIRQDGVEIEAALALDDWALARLQSGDPWRPLVAASIAVERSAFRMRLWELVERGSPEGLFELLGQVPDGTAALLCAASAWAEGEGRDDVAEALYHRALQLEPGSFKAHAGLGSLPAWRNRRVAEALPHLVAAHALEPDAAWVLGEIAYAYARAGDAANAIRACQSLLGDGPTSPFSAWPCQRVLQRADLAFSSASLDELIARGLELARTEERFAPSWWPVLGAALIRRYCPGETARALEIARAEVERTHRRDPSVLILLSTVEAAAGRQDDAVRTLEEAGALPGTPPVWRRQLRAARRAVRPRLVSYASIDAALDAPESLVEEGDTWRYFKGTSLPSAGTAWTRPEHDDSGWLEGRTCIGYGHHDDATVLDDMQGSYVDVYARRALLIPDPGLYSRIVLSVDADDGFAAWINGQLAGAARMDPETGRVTAASRPGTPVEIDITERVLAGRNVIAIRVANKDTGSSGLSLIPEVWATRANDPGAAAARFDALRAGVQWDVSAARQAYLDGRLALQRGDHGLAAEHFRKTIELDRTAIEPFQRLREAVARGEGEEAAERAFRAELVKGVPVAILKTPPAAPEGLRFEQDGSNLVFVTSPFRHADARVEHAYTRWQVRTRAGDYDRTPAIDVLSATHLTRLALGRHALEPRTQYFWRVIHYAASGVSATSAEATFTTGDYAFATSRFDLADHFNRDVVANPGDDVNDYADAVTGRFITDGFDGQDVRPEAIGLPADRAVGLHRLADYDGPNALQFGQQALLPIRILTPGGRFSTLRFLAAGSHGDSIVPLSLEYADGGVVRTSLRVEDWYDDPEPGPSTPLENWLPVRDGGVPILNGMQRQWERAFDARKDAALFELSVAVDPARELRAVVLEPAGMVMVHDRLALVSLFSIVGVRVGER